MKRAVLIAMLALVAGCGSPYRDAAVTAVHRTCNEQSVSTRDVTQEHEATRHLECERTRSTEDCTPIPAGAAWIRTDACRHAERWLCQNPGDGRIHCEPDTAAVQDETP